jgi:penicillin amidase
MRNPTKLKTLATLVFSAVMLILGGVYYLLTASLPAEHGKLVLKGLSSDVTVTMDKLDIPTIQAANRKDAFQVLGYLHARDRLFQMDLIRRVSAGRLAEIFGERALSVDKHQRDYQLEKTAQLAFLNLPAAHQAVLQAYTAGVNAYLTETSLLPPEFLALNYRPEPWRAEDSLLVALSMFQTLNGYEQDDRMLTVMADALPASISRFLTPDADAYPTVLLGGAESHRPLPAIPEADFAKLDNPALAAISDSIEMETPIAGSNNWVIAGSKTADGRAIIANDMHLPLRAPNIWYRAALNYAQVHLNGVTLPGLPLQIVGSNGAVAWGFTNATVDLLDLIKLEINPNNAQEYLTPQGWQAFNTTTEIIQVKNSVPVNYTVRSTLWGPVSSQALLGQPVAIKWIALEPQAADFGLLEMDSVNSIQAAMQVMNHAGGPAQNVVLADKDGHIGWTYMGYFPKRRGDDGLVSRSWADGSVAWDGFIPATELPHVFDPATGFIATANNRTLGKDYPYVLGYNWDNGYRAYRIAELLQQKPLLNEADLLQIQLDTRAEILDFYRDLALKALKDTPDASAALALHAWDGYMHSNSKGVALLTRFRTHLAAGVFAKVVAQCRKLDPQFNYAWREMETPLRALLTQSPTGVLPSTYHDNWEQFIQHSLQTSVEELTKEYPQQSLADLEWASVRSGSIDLNSKLHFISGIPAIGYAAILTGGNIPA